MKGDEIVLACNRYNNETATLRKHVTKYKNLRKWIVEFLKKSESRGDKLARNIMKYHSGNIMNTPQKIVLYLWYCEFKVLYSS